MLKDAFPILKSDRLVLRKLKPSDQNEIFRLRSDPGVNKYLDRTPAKSIQDAIEFINKIKQDTKDKEWIYWAITMKNKNKLIGTICFWNISEDDREAEIGFELIPEYQGIGIIQESIPSVLKFGFENLKLLMLSAVVHPENSKSINLLKKFNFVQDPDSRVVFSDEICFILNSEDYKLNKD